MNVFYLRLWQTPGQNHPASGESPSLHTLAASPLSDRHLNRCEADFILQQYFAIIGEADLA